MKKNSFTRLLALVMTIVLMLGTCSAAFAEAEFSIDNYNMALKKTVDAYYNQIMGSASYMDVLNVFIRMSDSEYDAFVALVTGDEKTAMENHINALYEAHCATQRYAPVVAATYTRVAPFLKAVDVSGAARVALLAEGQDTEKGTTDEIEGIKLNKSVTPTPDTNGVYTITLEAYVTGAKTVTEVSKVDPTDVVLVLDQSGSMEWCIGCGNTSISDDDTHRTVVKEGPVFGTTWKKSLLIWEKSYYGFQLDSGELYIKTETNNRQIVNKNPTEDDKGYYYYSYTDENNETKYVYPKLSDSLEQVADRANNYQVVQFYGINATFEEACSSRYDALVTAVTTFKNEMQAKAVGGEGANDDVHHRLAIVGFASKDRNTEILTAMYDNNVGVKYNQNGYSNAVKTALQDMATTAGQNMVNRAINALAHDGATRSDLGMKMAEDIFANSNYEPPAGVDLDADGKSLPRKQIVIMFTDGTPTSGNSWQTSVANDAIINAGTLKAQGVTVYTVGVFNGADATRLPTDANALARVSNENRYMHYTSSNFKNAESMDEPNDATYPDSGSYYLSASSAADLSGIFKAISNNVVSGGSATELKEATVIKDIVADSFQLPKGATESSIKVYTEDYTAKGFTNRQPFKAKVILDGTNVSVSNFNYSENWVGTETTTDASGNSTVVYRGKRLIIEVPIVVRDGFLGGNSVITNADGSGIYENDQAEEPLKEFISPDVDVEIDEVVTVAVPDTNVYLLDDVSASQLEPILDISIGDVELDMTKENYGLADWQKAYVTINDNEALDGFTDLTEDKTYSVTVKVKPTTTGNATGKEGTATGNIKVFKPVLTFADSVENYLSTPSYTDDYYNKTNYMGVVWEYGEGEDKKVSTDSDITMATTTPPTLDLTYTPAQDTWIDSSKKVVSTADIPVNVSATIGGVNVDQYTKAIREACTTCDFKKTEATEITTLNPEFIVHIKNVYGELKIIKKGLRKGESAVFTVNGTVADGTANGTAKKWTVVLTATDDNADATATITGLLVGSTYTVTEDPNWTWSYIEGEPHYSYETIRALNTEGAPATVTIQNTKKDKWLHYESSVENVFNGVNPQN